MSVAIDADGSEPLRAEVEAEYRRADTEVPDESEASLLTTSFENECC